ncbi:hypothetical protein [Pelagicoccus albus]|uniref:Uncharacterized protein n=1 Tax=Pelagicoccus albus TaxID=415222 RepID=A0A7X1B3C1_9BACT|nr:hypothetical protein [Pelagicoccus albus]MBC2604827.1 hypothetical protein [Pelagicoccus albus]
MRKTALSIYFVLMCFALMVASTVFTVIGAYDLMKMVLPDYGLTDYQYEYYKSSDVRDPYMGQRLPPPPGTKEKELTEEEKEIEKQEWRGIKDEEYEEAKDIVRAKSKKSLGLVVVSLLVLLPSFLIHYKKLKKVEQVGGHNSGGCAPSA